MAQKPIQLGAFGVWTFQLDVLPAARMQETAAELEEMRYGALWYGEAIGREALTKAGLLLAGTKRIIIATGIANIYGRDPVTMAAGQNTLCEAYPNRFLLGLGVSHIPLVETVRGHRYDKPVPAMRAYLDAMDHAPYQAVPPPSKLPRVLAALGPMMLKLSAERADGAHPYNTTPKHTAQARELLGPDPAEISCDLSGPAQLHEQLVAAWIPGKRHQQRRKRQSDRCRDRLGRFEDGDESNPRASRSGSGSCLHSGAHGRSQDFSFARVS